VKQGGRDAYRGMEAEVGTEKLGGRQPDRGEWVSRSRQIEVGRSGMKAIIHAGRWTGRRQWPAVAGPKREAGRLSGRGERGCGLGRRG
jgi:hypothetical protein